jgi:hypothetical protein
MALPIVPILLIKKLVFSAAGKFFLKSAAGGAVLGGIGYVFHKGLEFVGVYDEMGKPRCDLCRKPIAKAVILAAPATTVGGDTVYTVRCPHRPCPGETKFKKSSLDTLKG